MFFTNRKLNKMVINDLLKISQVISEKQVNGKEFSDFLNKYEFIDKTYLNLILKKNGLLWFESALQIYPYDNSTINLKILNDMEGWRQKYFFITRSYFCFAQDLFGFQFCFTERGVEIFNTEIGEFEFLAKNFEQWTQMILDDYNYLTGYEIAHEWQTQFGKLKINERLSGKIPFILGGDYSIENLYSINFTNLVEFRADLANQIYNLEDGQQIILKHVL